MLKIIGAFFVIITGIMLGFSASAKLSRRVQFLEGYISALKEASIRIRYTACDITELFRCDGSGAVDIMLRLFTQKVKSGKSAKNAWTSAVNTLSDKKQLAKEDKTLIEEFGTTFGTSDVDGELTHIQAHITLLSDRLEKARTEQTEKSKLYKILGLFGGVTLAVIFI